MSDAKVNHAGGALAVVLATENIMGRIRAAAATVLTYSGSSEADCEKAMGEQEELAKSFLHFTQALTLCIAYADEHASTEKASTTSTKPSQN